MHAYNTCSCVDASSETGETCTPETLPFASVASRRNTESAWDAEREETRRCSAEYLDLGVELGKQSTSSSKTSDTKSRSFAEVST